ncbi:globin-coupled sensor protein [Exiguobacterium sp. MMG028]|uniref:globin-coupled sensor protein n=1 Tax=Exiguobacterium sp. MMG028 TaxID=3021979 RepID=UPI0022FDE2B7|nr:globin-coupled sensor protein [Exiguobacterium sp. MMG028]MDA5559234.1 globin-coupled sensor protein [Exiguobacterium sp. MMG028]
MFARKRNMPIHLDISSQMEHLLIALPDELERQRQLIRLEREDLAYLRAYQHELRQLTPRLVDVFYEELEKIDEMRALIRQHSSSDKLKLTLSNHIMEMFEGKLNEPYIHRRLAIAKRHYLIGLKGKWYMAAFQKIFETLVLSIQDEQLDAESKMKLMMAVSKIFNFEQQIVLEMFDDEAEVVRDQMQLVKDEISQTIQQASEDLAALSQEVMASFQSMNERADDMKHSSSLTQTKLRTVLHSSVSGKDAILSETGRLDEITRDLSDSAQEIKALEKLMNEIMTIADSVKQIANQTNLLSLNAAIEAARAGEQGKGFQVVASEVRTLASQSKQAAEEVEDLVKRLTNQMEETSSRVLSTEQEMKQTMGRINQVTDAFLQISGDSEHADGQMGSLAGDIDEIVESIAELKRATTQIATSSTQLMDTAQRL